MKRKKHIQAAIWISAILLAGSLWVGFFCLRWLRLYWPGLPGIVFWICWMASPGSFILSGRLPRGRVKSFFRHVGEGWFTLSLYPLLYAGLATGVGILCRLGGVRLPLRQTGWAVLALAGLTLLAAVPNALRLRLTRYTIQLDKPCPDLRLVLLSDLHLGFFTPRWLFSQLRDTVNRCRPDLILIAGDLFDEDARSLRRRKEGASILAAWESTGGVFACEGNHDLLAPGPEAEEFFRQAGIRLLRDQAVSVSGITLAGRRDYRGRARLSPEELLAGVSRDQPVVVLDHNPAGSRELAGAGPDLILCGHTHNGQSFPGNWLGRLFPYPFYGLHTLGRSRCVVTSGAGLWGFPVRLGSFREIVVIQLSGSPPESGS